MIGWFQTNIYEVLTVHMLVFTFNIKVVSWEWLVLEYGIKL